jgi:hypothetical protein
MKPARAVREPPLRENFTVKPAARKNSSLKTTQKNRITGFLYVTINPPAESGKAMGLGQLTERRRLVFDGFAPLR